MMVYITNRNSYVCFRFARTTVKRKINYWKSLTSVTTVDRSPYFNPTFLSFRFAMKILLSRIFIIEIFKSFSLKKNSQLISSF